MNQTKIETSVFSVRNGAIVGGIATAIGYLFLIIWMVVNNQNISEPGPNIAVGVFGCILSLAVLGVHSWLDRNAKLIAVGVIGFVLLLLKLSAASRLGLLGDAAIMFGASNAAMGFGFALAIVAMACLLARRDSPDNDAVRYALLGLGITGALLYLVTTLNALTEGGRWRGLGAVFAGGNVALIVFASLVLLGLMGVLVIGLIAGTKQVAIKSVCQWGVALGALVFYLTVGYVFLDFFIGLMKYPDQAVKFVLILILNLVTGIGTLFGPAFICVTTLGRVVESLSHWRQWDMENQFSTERPVTAAPSNSPTSTATPARSKPAPAAAAVPTAVEGQLKTLKDLYEQGLISQQEYNEKRAEILKRL